VHDFYLEVMRNSPNRLEPHYCRRLLGLSVDTAACSAGGTPSYPVTVRLERIAPPHQAQIETVKAGMSSVATGREAPCAVPRARTAGDSASQAGV